MESPAPNATGSYATATAATVMDVIVSSTVAAANATAATTGSGEHGRAFLTVAVVFIFAFGITGNLLALYILNRTQSSSNQKHGFMLRCLATNDVIALAGMFMLRIVSLLGKNMKNNPFHCKARVLMRFFGLGSGCVAIVMAIERWLALTKPFFYQKHISLRLLKQMMVMLWLGVFGLVCGPFIGFGLYWDEKTLTCKRYRDAKKPFDVLYAYMYFSFGVFLCIAIVYTNLAVMKALCMKNGLYNKHNVLMRRVSRGSSLTCNAATKEERSFGWLMFILCIFFVICWIPQMVLVPLSIHASVMAEKFSMLCNLADVLLSMHFALDPYVYVLQHWTLVKSIFMRTRSTARANGGGSTSVSRSSSMRTTYEVYSQQP